MNRQLSSTKEMIISVTYVRPCTGPALASAPLCPAVLWADTDLLSGMPL